MVKYSSDASLKDIWIFGGFIYGLILFIVTCVYACKLMKKKKEHDKKKLIKTCCCTPCIKKNYNPDFDATELYNTITSIALILFAWVFLVIIVLKIQSISPDDSLPPLNDPFDILGVNHRSTLKQIKRAYRKLLVKHHPDHGGDTKMFMEISNAYKILTDEASREKWERYGNLDGPTQQKYGIALPIWLVSDKTPPTIIILYYLFVLIGIPGMMYFTWKWFFPGKPELKTGEPIIGLFYRYFKESPLIPIKRLIIIISACPMFDPDNMKRRSAHLALFPLIKQLLTQLQMNKEMMRAAPFNSTFSVEARALIWAQLSRLSLEHTLLYDYQQKVLTSCRGILGMILHEISPLWRYINYELQQTNTTTTINTHFASRISTVENCIKLCGCLVQSLQISDNNLLMLPHITNLDIARLQQKKKNIKGILDYIKLPPQIRLILLSQLNNLQRHDIHNTFTVLPHIEMIIRIRGDDDTKSNDNGIAVNSLFNVDIIFERKSLATAINENDKAEQAAFLNGTTNGSVVTYEMKPSLKKTTKKTNKKKKSVKFNIGPDQTSENVLTNDTQLNGERDDAELYNQSNVNVCWPKSIEPLNHKKHVENASKIQTHCPLFPSNLCESWWIYITMNDASVMYTPTLQRTECIEDGYTCYIQGEAPSKPGVASYTIHLISDVYHNLHFTKTFNVFMVEENPIDTQHHWDISSSGSDVDLSVVTDEEVEVSHPLVEDFD